MGILANSILNQNLKKDIYTKEDTFNLTEGLLSSQDGAGCSSSKDSAFSTLQQSLKDQRENQH